MMTGRDDIELKKPIHNGTYAIEKTYTKPYAACRYLHPAIEGAIMLRNQHNLTAEEIESVHVDTYFWAVNKHDHCEIPCSASAKMSIPYSVAAAVVYGKAGLQEYDEEIIRDDRLLDLAKKVTVADDEELTRIFPEITSAIITVKTLDGRQLQCRVDHPKGEPENPLTDREFYERFCELVKFSGKSAETADEIFNFVQNGCSDWNKLSELVR